MGLAVDGAQRMRAMIGGLLDLSRVHTRARDLALTDCNALLQRVLHSLQLALEDSGATVTNDSLPEVMADGVQLGLVFQNLIGNAIKFHGADAPRVRVAAERQEGAWVFSVQDNGIGFDPRHADEIFGVFQRLHTQQQYPGLGMGLALCRRIVERHGGRIWAESQPGEGATFYFTLPISDAAD